MLLHFKKFHGLGNDFVFVDARESTIDFTTELAIALCDRHRGIGADGLLLWRGSVERPSMQVINADGSEPEMCGNGLRCFVKALLDHHSLKSSEISVLTGAGLLRCTATRDSQGHVDMVAVRMGKGEFAPAQVPMLADKPLIAAQIPGLNSDLKWTALSVGNSHVVTFDLVDEGNRLALGPVVARHPLFPRGVNVEFAQILAEKDGQPRMRVDVCERGCGWTQACGTGATAAAIASVHAHLNKPDVEIAVILPGGTLGITVAAAGMATMRGPATEVYAGAIDLRALVA